MSIQRNSQVWHLIGLALLGFALAGCTTLPVDDELSFIGSPEFQRLLDGEIEFVGASSEVDGEVLLNGVPGADSDKIYVGSFNIRVFGQRKSRNQKIMQHLATITQQHDLLAIQEIKDVSGRTPGRLLSTISANGANYAFIASQRSGKNRDD